MSNEKTETPTRVRGVFLGVTALYWISLYLYVPILAPYAEFRGGTPTVVGLVVGAYGLAQLLLRIPLGLVSDRMGRRKPFLTLGFISSSAACLWFVFATDAWSMVGARFISGIAACAWVAFSVLFASYFPSAQATRAMAYITFCNNLAVMSATYVGGRLADAWGWTAPFWASVGVGLLGAVSVSLVHERPRGRSAPQSPLRRIRSVMRYPELVLASVVAALGQYNTFATIFSFVPNYAVGIGATKTQLGILTMLGTLSSSVATLLSGTYVAPRMGPRLAVFLGYLTVAATTVAIPYLETVEALYASQVIAGFGRGATYPILMGLAIARLPDGERATAMGFFQAVYAVGMFAGPVAAGMVGDDLGYTSLFLSTGAVAVLTALVALRLPKRS